MFFGNVLHIWNKTCGKILSLRWIQSAETGKQTFANTLLSCFFKQGESFLVISGENWTDIVGINKNNTRSDSQIHKIIVIMLTVLIVSITKFSIVIGSPRAYLSRNRRAITWVSDYRCPTPVIGYPRDFHVNYARFNGFLSNVFYSFQILG